MNKFKEIHKLVLLALVLSLAFASCEGYAESKMEKCAAKLIVHTNDTVIDTVYDITGTCSPQSNDWYDRYLYTVAVEYGKKIGIIFSFGEKADPKISSIVDQSELRALLNDSDASVGRLFFAGQAAGNCGDTGLAKELLWKAYEKSGDKDQKIRILDEIASYAVFSEAYNYLEDGLLYGKNIFCGVTPLNLIREQNIDECISILGEYNKVIDKYSIFKHCSMASVSGIRRMNYCELYFQVAYYCVSNNSAERAITLCSEFAQKLPKLTIDETDKDIYRTYMYGFQSCLSDGLNRQNSQSSYNSCKVLLIRYLDLKTVNSNLELIDSLLEAGQADAPKISCCDRTELEKLTRVPSIGVTINNIDQLTPNGAVATTIVVQLSASDDGALRCFYDRSDGTGINDTDLSRFNTPWYNELLSSYGISRDMILTHVGLFLELPAGDVIKPYESECFSYKDQEDIRYLVVATVPCKVIVDEEAIISGVDSQMP